jgi:hypothetical protein
MAGLTVVDEARVAPTTTSTSEAGPAMTTL